jgi:hypothetical protein
VGKAYTAMLGLKPGDAFEIKLGRNQVRLVPVGGKGEGKRSGGVMKASGRCCP